MSSPYSQLGSPAQGQSLAQWATDAINYAWSVDPNGYYQQISEHMPFLAKMSGGGNNTYRRGDFSGRIEMVDTLIPRYPNAPWFPTKPITIQAPITEFVIVMAFNALELEQVRGPNEFAHMLEVQTQNAMDTTKRMFGEMMFGDGMAWNGRAFNGVQALLNATDGGGKVLDVDASKPENAWWRNQVIDLTTGRGMGPNGTMGDPRPASPAALTEVMGQAWRLAMHGDGMPDCIVTDAYVSHLYEQSMHGQLGFTDRASAERGFGDLVYRGIPVIWDQFCPFGMMYMINSRQMYLRASDERNMTVMNDTPIWSQNQTAFITMIGWAGQTWMTNRRNQVAMRIAGVA